MNFRRIFLIKCMLLLFPSVKCSVSNLIYTAVNESVFLHIAVAAENIYDATWLRDRKKLLQLKDNKVKYYVNKDQCRCKVFLNGTLRIERVVKEDSGKYTVTVYQKDGKLSAEEDKTFIVQEPVPQPILSSECINKSASVKCEVKQKNKDETFIIELTQDKSKKIQKNATRKKKAERLGDYEDEQVMQARQADSEMVVRELPQPPSNPTPKQLRIQQRPLPQPQGQQQAVPPRPRPRTQQRTPNHPRERP
ncbi:T-cell surface antigen CD2 isoform X2 [Columba livia]|uniref:T-cell surface antigen CD2 isoform X2 n=1 Tax=Columba livia TaxID=8932 RepID=UPI0031BA2409